MSRFFENLPENFKLPETAVEQKILKEYGAVFIAGNNVIPPNTIVFKNQSEVLSWQSGVPQSKENIGGYDLQLQTPAMKALKKAITEAEQNNLTITPRSADSARRDYSGTVELWASRVNPGLIHWVSIGKLSEIEAERIESLSPFEQVSEILRLESQGIYFAKDLSKSIIYSVAPPGTSQHIAMLAFDVCEFDNPFVCEILAKHGWFQTVISDLPHFTYLGVSEKELDNLGLKKVSNEERIFWIPDI